MPTEGWGAESHPARSEEDSPIVTAVAPRPSRIRHIRAVHDVLKK